MSANERVVTGIVVGHYPKRHPPKERVYRDGFVTNKESTDAHTSGVIVVQVDADFGHVPIKSEHDYLLTSKSEVTPATAIEKIMESVTQKYPLGTRVRLKEATLSRHNGRPFTIYAISEPFNGLNIPQNTQPPPRGKVQKPEPPAAVATDSEEDGTLGELSQNFPE